jgi:integrase
LAVSNLTAAAVSTARYLESPAGWCAIWHHKLKGFGLRITETGARSYVVKYRLRGARSTRLRTIGPPSKYTFGEAYEVARQALRDAEVGRDYFEAIERERSQTMGHVWRYYVKEHLGGSTISERTRLDHGCLWRNHGEREFDRKSLAEITPEIVRGWHRRATRRGPYVANRAAQALRAAWNYGRKFGKVPKELENPFAAVTLNPERPRETILEPHQFPRLAKAINALENPFARAYLWTLFYTGCRRTELLKLKWADVEIWPAKKDEPKSGFITLREVKGGGVRRVALSAPATEVLEGLPRTSNPHVFAGAQEHVPVEPEDHWRRVRAHAELPELRMHDLRRSFGSWLGASGIAPKLIGAALGHKTDITSRVYVQLGEAANIKRQLAATHAALAEQFAEEKPRADVIDIAARARP